LDRPSCQYNDYDNEDSDQAFVETFYHNNLDEDDANHQQDEDDRWADDVFPGLVPLSVVVEPTLWQRQNPLKTAQLGQQGRANFYSKTHLYLLE
jgi:hypothetical protein